MSETIKLNGKDQYALFLTIDAYIKNKNYGPAVDALTYLEKKEIPDAIGRLARLYRDGNYYEKNIDRAIELYAEAYSLDEKWKYEYVDLLYRSDDKIDYTIAFNIVNDSKEETAAKGRLGRMYRDGKGVEQNLELSIKWYEQAIEDNFAWVPELIDVLLRTNSYDYHLRAKELCYSNLDKKTDIIYSRLGKIYRDGKSVDRDYSESSYWFGKAYTVSNVWKHDYIDVLLKSNANDVKKGIELCKEWATKNDTKCMIKLSYLIDTGIVNENNDDALKWAKKAYEQDKRYAPEYISQLIKTNDTDNIHKALQIANSNTNEHIFGLLGKYYSSQYIDAETHQIAREWYQKCNYTKICYEALDYADLLISFDNPEDLNDAFNLLIDQYNLGNTKVSVRLTQFKQYANAELKIRILNNIIVEKIKKETTYDISRFFKKKEENVSAIKPFTTIDSNQYNIDNLKKPLMKNIGEYALLLNDKGIKSEIDTIIKIIKEIIKIEGKDSTFFNILFEIAKKQKDTTLFNWIYKNTNNLETKIQCAITINSKSMIKEAIKIANKMIDNGTIKGKAYLGLLYLKENKEVAKQLLEETEHLNEEWITSRLFEIYVNEKKYEKALKLCENKKIESPYLSLQIIDAKLILNPNDQEAINQLTEIAEKNILVKLYFYEWVSRLHYNYDELPEGLNVYDSKKNTLLLYNNNIKDLSIILSMFPLSHYIVSHKIKSVDIDPFFGYVSRYSDDDVDKFDKILLTENINDNEKIPEEKLIKAVCGSVQSGITGFKKAIDCNFGTNNSDTHFMVYVPHKAHGLILSAINHYERLNTKKKSFEHILDLTNYPNSCTPLLEIGQYDAWNYYFEKTTPYTLDEIYESEKVHFRENDINTDISDTIKNESFKKNFHLSKWIKTIFEEEKNKLYGKKKNVLTIIYRGTDHLYAKGLNHPIPYDYQELIEVANTHMKKYGYDWIYLNTEDQDAYDLMVKSFGKKIFALDQKRYRNTGNKLIAHIMMNSQKPLQSMLDARNYLITILLSSKGSGFLTSHCFGSEAVKKICDDNSVWYQEMIKGRWQVNGKNPIVVVSTNKNYIKIPINEQYYRNVGNSTICFEKDVSNIESKKQLILLKRSTGYVISSQVKNIQGRLKLILYKNNNLLKNVEVKLGEYAYFELSDDADSYKISFEEIKITDQNVVKIQLESGLNPSPFTDHHESTTEIALRDIYGHLMENNITKIDLSNGFFEANGIKYLFNTNELKKWTNLIKFEWGIQYSVRKNDMINNN